MGFSIISFLIWIFNPISVIRSLMWTANAKIPVLSEDSEYGARRWSLVRKWGLRTLIILSLYILIIVIVLGWTFRWYPAYLVLQTFCFLILDRYLIAVNYDKKYWKDANEKTKREIKIIRVIRIPYIGLRVMFGLLMLLMIPFANVTDYTIETWLYAYKAKITNPKNSVPDIQYPFGTDINMYEQYKVSTQNGGKLIAYNDYAFYERKLFIFMKEVIDESTNPGFKLIGISQDINGKQEKQGMTELWARFYAEKAFKKLVYNDYSTITVVYTKYKGADSSDYTAIIGYAMPKYLLDSIPKGLNSWIFKPDKFENVKENNISSHTIAETWNTLKTQGKTIERKYTYDYEVYHVGKDTYISVR